MSRITFAILLLTLLGCQRTEIETNSEVPASKMSSTQVSQTSLVILGTVQDAGSPHIACKKDCCNKLFDNPDQSRKVVSIGAIDAKNEKTFMFEATPDMPAQMKLLKEYAGFSSKETPDGIFLTHAHIGHYTGLMYLGKEALNASKVPVYAMPIMQSFLESNGPWNQLVSTNNIEIISIENNKKINLTSQIAVTPHQVPHRDEYSETVGYLIEGPNKKALFIPDIDKWEKWETGIIDLIKSVDYALIDATFYDAEEVNNRNIEEIPHPFIIESLELFDDLPSSEKKKIHFIHFNHTNPLLDSNSRQFKNVIDKGYNIAQYKAIIAL